jgi:hypothetical protein
VTQASLRSFEVVLTGAFLTGLPLQAPVAESNQLQRTLGDALAAHAGEGWTYDPLERQDAGGSYDGSGGYPSLVPLVLVRREGDDLQRAAEQALERRPIAELRWLQQITEGWGWTLTAISIDIFGFGVGTVRTAYTVQPPESLGVDEVRRTIDLLSRLKPDAAEQVQPPLAAALETVTRATVARLSEEVDRTVAKARQLPWLTPMIAALGEPSEPGAPTSDQRCYGWGRLLWLHPVFVLSTSRKTDTAEAQLIAMPFLSDFHRSIDTSYGLFAPGIDISVIVCRSSTRARETFLWLLTLNWAYYALFMEIDRGLLATLDDERWRGHASLAELERDASAMFRVHMRVQNVHARLGSILMDIGGGALTLWDTIAQAQRFDALVTAVQVKVDLLQGVAEQRINEAAAVRARRTGNILRGLSALTLITVITAVIGTLIGSRSDPVGHDWIRIAAIAGAALLACLLYFVQRDIALRRERRRRLAWRRSVTARAPRAPGTGPRPPQGEPPGYTDSISLNR